MFKKNCPRLARRAMLGQALRGAGLAVLAGGALLATPVAAAEPAQQVVYIGTHTDKIVAANFDPAAGTLSIIGPVADNSRPTWAVRHPRLPIVYFNEQSGGDGKAQGGVQALAVDAASGRVTKLSDVRAGGGGTTLLWLDGPSSTLLAANYSSGSLATLPVAADGTLATISSLVSFVGSGPNTTRQQSPHPHDVSLDPTGHWALVTDLGADRIWVLPFDRQTGRLGAYDPASARHVHVAPGAGPRHMAWHPQGRWLYVVDELTARIDTYGWDSAKGELRLQQSLALDTPGFAGTPSASEVVMSADGRFVYVGNRGEHSLVALRADAKTGQLTQIQQIASGGKLPWHFTLDESGQWLLVSNRDSNTIAIFGRDAQTGLLANTGRTVSTPQPVFAVFGPARAAPAK